MIIIFKILKNMKYRKQLLEAKHTLINIKKKAHNLFSFGNR